ncbi:hypothetical protein F4775DRAFT_534719 [Biscogniauxia sp. FL1348]|nr:hypothetical protein F4775DRAFT_534719 [Biscogniauxia sp. FL1348]
MLSKKCLTASNESFLVGILLYYLTSAAQFVYVGDLIRPSTSGTKLIKHPRVVNPVILEFQITSREDHFLHKGPSGLFLRSYRYLYPGYCVPGTLSSLGEEKESKKKKRRIPSKMSRI